MNEFSDAIVYLNDPYNWTSSGGIADLTLEHLEIATVAVLAAMVIALPIGIALGTSGRGSGGVIVLSNVSRAVPTLALLADLLLAGVERLLTPWSRVVRA